MPGDNDTSADAKDKEPGGKDGRADKQPVRKWKKWSKRTYTFLAALGVVGGVLGFGTQVEHWFSGLSQASDATCHMSTSNQIERSPNLGISFHQNGQLALMSYLNSEGLQIPMVGVCLSSAPFEIWFPALSNPKADVEICVSPTVAIFHLDPFKLDGANTVGCLAPGTGVADTSLGSGFLSESSPQEPACYFVTSQRAEPAANGDEKYFVSNLYSVPSGKKFTSHTIPMSAQAANLYVIIYASSNYSAPYSDKYLEHFVLRFK
jgi:hypothetical protein